MKVSLRWLADYVDLPSEDPAELSRVLGELGHEVEGVERLEAEARGVVVARVEARREHPDADRIQLVTVATGRGNVEVVCGAWNLEVGDLVPYAPPGSVLAGGLEVGEREIRGVVSPGMICSEAELGLGEDHSGILILDGEAAPGADFTDFVPLPDVVLDVSITPNRPDCMSMVGIARELAARFGASVRSPSIPEDQPSTDGRIRIRIEDPEGCPRYVAWEISDVEVGPSPLWLRLRLRAAGLRPINNVVDVTNYVLMELGQPLHAFDQDLLEEETIVVRRARPGEVLRTLDGVERRLEAEDLVIADAGRAVALAGVMGGEETEVGTETRRVLIESAYFHPPRVMLTAKRHALRTEASARFERGVDPEGARRAARRAALLMEQVAGGEVGPVVDVYPEPVSPVRVELPLAEVPRLLGIRLERDEVAELLERLELEVEGEDPLSVTVPTFRPDLARPADLVEEVARLHGYHRIPETVAPGVGGGLPDEERHRRRLRDLMEGAGYSEAQTLSFLGRRDLDRLRLPDGDRRRAGIQVVNPLREEEGILRTTLLPGLLGALAYNWRHRLTDVALYEIGKVFLPDGPEIPYQPDHLAFAAAGYRGGHPLEPERALDVFDATGVWEVLAEGLGLDDARVRSASEMPFHPGRAAQVMLGDRPLGVVGELHPAVGRAFELEGRVVAGEILLEPLLAARPWARLVEPSVFPPVEFDLAFEVGDGVPAGELVAAVREAAGELLETVRLFDVFRGGPIPEGRKSVALRLVFRAPDHTLTDEEVAPLRQRVVAEVEERMGARLRGG